jgi:hypothetical protein
MPVYNPIEVVDTPPGVTKVLPELSFFFGKIS